MNRNRPFEPDDQDLPEGWDPADDLDPQLETIFRIAREAGVPPAQLLPASVDALRMATHRQLLIERLIHTDGDKPRGLARHFSAFRKVLFGGGPGAQMLRLGATASLAFAVAAGIFLNNNSAAAKKSAEMAALPPANGSSTVAAQNTAPAPAPAVVVADAHDSMTESPVPPSPDSHPEFSGVAVSRSAADERDNGGWTATAPSSRQWLYNRNAGQVAVSGDAAYPPGRPEATSQNMVDQIQSLKMNAMANSDERGLSNLRGLEDTLSKLMSQYERNAQPKMTALDVAHKAELQLAAGHYRDAVDSWATVPQLAPGSPLALVAEFQIGRIAYEKLDDFDLSKDSFKHCMEKYQGVPVSPEAHRYILDRLELLTQTQSDNWASLTAWRNALRATTAKDAVPELLKVLQDCSFEELAADAAARLRDYAVSSQTALDVDYQAVQDAISTRIAASTPGKHTAKMQFALADITLYRTRDYDLGKQQLQAALQMSPNAQMLRAIQTRLDQVAAQNVP